MTGLGVPAALQGMSRLSPSVVYTVYGGLTTKCGGAVKEIHDVFQFAVNNSAYIPRKRNQNIIYVVQRVQAGITADTNGYGATATKWLWSGWCVDYTEWSGGIRTAVGDGWSALAKTTPSIRSPIFH